jgi:hypothetical protein
MQFLGIDLAWADNPGSLANETGLVLLAGDGTVVDAGWSRGIQETLGWVSEHVHGSDVLAFVDAPLVVSNATGQRLCETQVGQRYGHWKVSANSTNLGSKNIAGVSLLELLEERGWIYDDGHEGPPERGRTFSTRRCVPGPGLSGTGIRSGAVRSWGNDVAMGMAVPERPRSSPRPSRLKGCRTRLLDARTRCRRPVIRTPNDSNTVLKPRLDDMRGTP